MAFAAEVTKGPVKGSMGKYKMVWGSYISTGGSTGGDINTRMNKCFGIILMPVSGDSPTVDEAVYLGPVDGKAVTIATDANGYGQFMAWGQ